MERTAISAEQEGEVVASRGRATAAIAVLLLATGVAALPVIAALGLWSNSFGRLATGLTGLVAVFGALKLAAAAWGAAASID